MCPVRFRDRNWFDGSVNRDTSECVGFTFFYLLYCTYLHYGGRID